MQEDGLNIITPVGHRSTGRCFNDCIGLYI